MILVWQVLVSEIVCLYFLLDGDLSLSINKLINVNKNINSKFSYCKDHTGFRMATRLLSDWIIVTGNTFTINFRIWKMWYLVCYIPGAGNEQKICFLWTCSHFLTSFSDFFISLREILQARFINFAFSHSGEAFMASILDSKKITQIIQKTSVFIYVWWKFAKGCQKFKAVKQVTSLFTLIILSRFIWITVNGFIVVPTLMLAVFGAGFIGGLWIGLFLT